MLPVEFKKMPIDLSILRVKGAPVGGREHHICAIHSQHCPKSLTFELSHFPECIYSDVTNNYCISQPCA